MAFDFLLILFSEFSAESRLFIPYRIGSLLAAELTKNRFVILYHMPDQILSLIPYIIVGIDAYMRFLLPCLADETITIKIQPRFAMVNMRYPASYSNKDL